MDRSVAAARHGDLTRGCAGRGTICAPYSPELLAGSRRDASRRTAPLRARRTVRPMETGLWAASPELETAPVAGDLEVLNQGNYYEFLAAQGDTLVVVDFYTNWCGPCKLIHPDLVKMAAYYQDVRIVRFNMTKESRALGKELGVRVAPTFLLYRSSQKVAQLTGAKVDKLKELIEEHRK